MYQVLMNMVIIPFKAQSKCCQSKPHSLEWFDIINLLESIKKGLRISASVKECKKLANNDGNG